MLELDGFTHHQLGMNQAAKVLGGSLRILEDATQGSIDNQTKH